jgi:hypothetical protein
VAEPHWLIIAAFNLGEDIMFEASRTSSHIPEGRFMWKLQIAV